MARPSSPDSGGGEGERENFKFLWNDLKIAMPKIKTSEIEKLLTRVHRDAEILAVLNFGSTSRQEQTPLSDIDICLILVPRSKPFDPQALTIKRLEYLKEFSLDVQIFQQLPLYIRKRVLKEGRILFVREESQLYELAFRTAKTFEDFRHIYYDYLKEVAQVDPIA